MTIKAKADNSRVLKDQVPTQRAVASETLGFHENRRQLDERAFYPPHDARTESSEYAKVHKHLCIELDLPCLVCGVRHSTLKVEGENPYHASAMETHHHIIEWALANAIDVDKFNKSIRPNLAHRHPKDATWGYENPFDAQKVHDWVDHSEHNLWVLCDVHHRHKYLGIHEISYPIWCPQDLLRPDFEQQVRKELGINNA